MKPLALQRTFIDISLTFGRQFLAGIIQLCIIVLISRILGPEGAGYYALALLLPSVLAQLLNLGLVTSNVYFIASKQFKASTAWAVSRDIGLLIGTLGFLAGCALVALLGDEAFPGVPAHLLYLSLCVFPISLMAGMVTSVFQGLQDFKSFNLLAMTQPVIALAGLVALWSLNAFDLLPILVATIFSHIISLAISAMMLARQVPIGEPRSAGDHYLGRAIRYGYKVHLGNLISFLNYRSDLFLVNFFIGPAAAGIYIVAVRLVEQLWMISQAVSAVILPRLSSLNDDEDSRRALTPLIARFVLSLTLLISIFLAIFAATLVEMIFGEAFLGAANVVLILLPGVVFLACGRVLANDVAARGLVHINLFLAITVLTVNITGNLLLIPHYGITGAAMATTFAYSFNFFIRLTIQQRITKVPWWHNILLQHDDLSRLRRFFNNMLTSKR